MKDKQLKLNLIKRLDIISKEIIRRSNNDKLSRYNTGKVVHKKQMEFHKSQFKNRWVFGGNRSGKTECGAVETVWLATGTHPYKTNKKNMSCWVVSLSSQVQRDVAQSKILYYLNPDLIVDIVMSQGKKEAPYLGIIDTIIVKNALLELDLETKNLNIMRGVDIRNLNAVFDDKVNKVIVCYYDGTSYKIGELGNFGKVFTTVLPKCWQSPFSDFGYPEKYKIIKDIYLKSDDAVTITIRTEKLSKSYTLNPKDGVVHLRTLIKGKHIAIDFESNSDSVKISTPTVIMGLV